MTTAVRSTARRPRCERDTPPGCLDDRRRRRAAGVRAAGERSRQRGAGRVGAAARACGRTAAAQRRRTPLAGRQDDGRACRRPGPARAAAPRRRTAPCPACRHVAPAPRRGQARAASSCAARTARRPRRRGGQQRLAPRRQRRVGSLGVAVRAHRGAAAAGRCGRRPGRCGHGAGITTVSGRPAVASSTGAERGGGRRGQDRRRRPSPASAAQAARTAAGPPRGHTRAPARAKPGDPAALADHGDGPTAQALPMRMTATMRP